MDSAPTISGSLLGITTSNFSALNPFMEYDTYSSFSQSTFSFQDALKPTVNDLYSDDPGSDLHTNPIYLFTDGCDNNGTQNCSVSCADKGTISSNLNTFHNCVVYPIVAQLYADGNLSTSAKDSALVEGLGIQKSKQGSELLNNVTSTISSCLVSLCTQSSECKEGALEDGAGILTSANITAGLSSWNANFRLQELANALCDSQTSGLNSDVGGIGVYVSYWIQSGLAILGSLSAIWWGWGVYYCCFVVRSLGHGHRAGKEYAQKIGAKWGNKRLPTVISALTEFQKAQCFFMLAINIAAQINRGRGGWQPTSLQQLFNNYIFIKAISVSGYLPITLTLFTLHTVDMVSWYLVILSVLTVAISTATLVDIGNFVPSHDDVGYLSQQAATGGPSECANENILVYCLDSGNYVTGQTGSGLEAYKILGFCLFMLVLLILKQTGIFRKSSDLRRSGRLSKTQDFFFTNFVGIRGFQLLLTVLTFLSQGWGSANLVFPCGFFSCLLYIFITSDLHYRPRTNVAGKFFNKWIVLATDALSFSLAFAYLIIWTILSERNDGLRDLVIILGVFLVPSFTLTLILTSVHVHHTRKYSTHKHRSIRRYPFFMRRLAGTLSLRWQVIKSITFNTEYHAFKSHTSRFERNMRAAGDVDEWTSKLFTLGISLLYVGFFGLYCFWFAIFFGDLYLYSLFVDTSTWSFGQIVAITVWTQPLCEYFHLELRGMTRGFQYRLMWPYKVVVDSGDVGAKQDAADDPATPPAANCSTSAGRGSYKMLTRQRGDSTAVDRGASPSIRGDARTGPLQEPSARTSTSDNPERERGLDESRNDQDEPRASNSISEEQDISYERRQIPATMLTTSVEL